MKTAARANPLRRLRIDWRPLAALLLLSAALIAFYNAAAGPNWLNRDNWLTDAPRARWHGVETDPSGRVSILALHGNGLQGTVPPALGQLASLTVLDLGGNGFSGPLPPELGNLRNLEQLYLPFMQLSGPIPPRLANARRLLWIDLSGNQLTGCVPKSLFRQLDVPQRVSRQALGGLPSC